jgi:outer membrane protein W
MKNVRIILPALAALVLTYSPSQAQDLQLKGSSSIELNVGLWSAFQASNVVSTSGVQTEAKIGAFVGGIFFSHWLQEYLSVTLSAGLLAGKASSTVNVRSVTQHVSSVVPLLLGVRYYVFESAADGQIRPYLSAAVGPYIGSEVNNTLLAQETRTETAFGGRLGAGIDFFVSNHFKLGANTGYHLMTDFDAPVGARSNYNGGDLTLGLGYMF